MWAYIPVDCLYDPSNTNVILDGVSICDQSRSFPLLLIEDSFYNAHREIHFAYWALPISRDVSIDSTTFGGVLYVRGVGGFTMDTSLIVMLHINLWFVVRFVGLWPLVCIEKLHASSPSLTELVCL